MKVPAQDKTVVRFEIARRARSFSAYAKAGCNGMSDPASAVHA